MTKNQKMLLGVGVAAVGYLVWKQMSKSSAPTATFASATGMTARPPKPKVICNDGTQTSSAQACQGHLGVFTGTPVLPNPYPVVHPLNINYQPYYPM